MASHPATVIESPSREEASTTNHTPSPPPPPTRKRARTSKNVTEHFDTFVSAIRQQLEAEIADKLNAVTMERNRLREQLRRMRASSESIADIRDRAQVAYSKLKQDMQVLLDKTNAEKTELQRAHVDLQRAHTELQHAFAQLQKDYMDDRMAIAMIAGRIYDPAIAASVERVMGAPSPVMASVWMQPSPPPHYQQPPSAVGSDPEKTKMPRSA